MPFVYREELTPALDKLKQLEEQDLVTVAANFHSNRTVPPTAIEGNYPMMMHLPYGGDVSYLTIDGDPVGSEESTAPIQERKYKLKSRLLLMSEKDFNDNPQTGYDAVLLWEDVYPTFAALHRQLTVGGVAYCRRFQVAEREEGQMWALSVFNFKNENHIGVEWLSSITLDATIKVGM